MRMKLVRESLYALFESPDDIDNYKFSLGWSSDGARAIGMYNGVIYVGPEQSTHRHLRNHFKGDLMKDEVTRWQYEYPGRVWTDDKIFSFWKYPSREIFKKIVNAVEEKVKKRIWGNPEWLIETIVDANGNPYSPEDINKHTSMGVPDFGAQYKIIPITEYMGSFDYSDEEIKKDHEVSPLLKKNKIVPSGFGSKHPEAQNLFKTKLQATFESYYNALNESPDHVAKPSIGGDEGKYGPDVVAWYDEPALPFGYYHGDFYAGKPQQIHDDIRIRSKEHIWTKDHMRHEFKYPGRIFLNSKLISFWKYPPKEAFPKFAADLKEETGIDIMQPEYLIEIINNPAEDDTNSERFYRTRWDGDWKDMYNREAKPEISWISPKDYIGSQDQSEEDLNKQHVVSPLLKKNKNIPSGFGSKHPDAAKQFKSKMQAPFESRK